jgi:hypothetical protein
MEDLIWAVYSYSTCEPRTRKVRFIITILVFLNFVFFPSFITVHVSLFFSFLCLYPFPLSLYRYINISSLVCPFLLFPHSASMMHRLFFPKGHFVNLPLVYGQHSVDLKFKKKKIIIIISMALARKRTIPTERPPLVGEINVNFCG